MPKYQVPSTKYLSGVSSRLIRFAWVVLGYNILVILGGAFVRATGSGAGCGPSWPTCHGELLPELEGATSIEFAHRAMSGVVLVLAVVLVIWVWRATGAGHLARTGAVLTLIATVIEAGIGAMLVLAEWVADDTSVARTVAVPLHLVNTLFLLAAIVLTIRWLSGGGRLDWRSPHRRWVLAGAVAVVLLAATGAVTALADTLFPAGGDLTDEEHFLTALRIVHPILALILILSAWVLVTRTGLPPGRAARALPVLVGALAFTGVLNIALRTPIPLQLVHLLLADLLWVAFVLLAARMMSADQVPATA